MKWILRNIFITIGNPIVEIHGSRTVAFNKKFRNSQNGLFFRVRMLPLRYVEFCKKISMKRQKWITFKKKFIKNDLFVEEICDVIEQKSTKFPLKSGKFSMGNQWKSMFEHCRDFQFPLIFHWKFPRFWREISHFCSWKSSIFSTNKSFLINFFFESYSFLTLHRYFLQNPT